MLKILHVTPSFYPAFVYGGPTYSVYQLCLSLVRQGCQVRVLTTDANGPDSVLDVSTESDVEVQPGLSVRYCHRITDVSVSPALLRSLIAKVRWADVVHLMAVYSFPTIPTLLACRMLGKPVVWSPRGMLQRWEGTRHPELKTLWDKICSITAPKQLVLHATSEEEARESRRRLPGVETVVVPNGVELSDGISHEISVTTLRLLYLGRLHPKKGIENLLTAYKIVRDNLSMTSSLIIAGEGEDGYDSVIRARVDQLGLAQHVRMIGRVEGKAKEKLFANTDVVVVPSYTENFGMVVAEALAHAVPVIASHGTPWRRIEEIGCGLWVANDPESLAAAITRMSQMRLRDMGHKGRGWMHREFAWDFVGDKMTGIYRNLIASS